MRADRERQLLARIRDDAPWYGQHLAKIVDKNAELVPLTYRPAQMKLWEAIQRQRERDLPVRVIVLKSRQTGISTAVQQMIIQRATTRANRRALVVAHNATTAGALFGIGENIYLNLPDDPFVKPEIKSRHSSENGRKLLHWGTKDPRRQEAGDVGVNSILRIDTAKEVEAGRGLTIHDLHASEVALWPDPSKCAALLNAVPKRPGTMIILESTARGANFFKERWDRAVAGLGDFEPLFISWLEDPDCRRPFRSDQEREHLISTIGAGAFGAAEPMLMERMDRMGIALEEQYERLAFRRVAIVDDCDGKPEVFAQEYPSTPEEAFIASGNTVFSKVYIGGALSAAEGAPEPRVGVLKASATRTRTLLDGTVEIPTGVEFWPADATGFRQDHPFWHVWRTPEKDGQYIVTVDPAGDIENHDATERDDHAYSAIEVIDHASGEQVAEWRGRADHDQVAMQAFLAGLWYREAILGVEVSGGYGTAITRALTRLYYRRLYQRQQLDTRKLKTAERIGWSTDRRTKPQMEANFAELLREGTHGIRSVGLARELGTYIRDDRGKHRPEEGAHSDRLLAFMQAHEIRRLTPLRVRRDPSGPRPNSLTRVLR